MASGETTGGVDRGNATRGARPWPALLTVLLGTVLYLGLPLSVPVPGATAFAGQPADWVRGLHLFAIFVTTIVGIVLNPLPMGAVAMIGIAVTVLTGTLPVADAMSGFSDVVIWLIVLAFFISRGFVKTGLGARVAYSFVALLGKHSLGLSYGLAATDLVLAPAIPSNTGRAGGIVMHIVSSIARAFDSRPGDGSERKIGAFLISPPTRWTASRRHVPHGDGRQPSRRAWPETSR
jgi:DASS family divalent anion:Na+ symporter